MSQTTIIRPRASVGPTIREADGSALTFDACVSEAPSLEGSLTKHPVEDGADISDHFQPEPITLAMIVGVTNTPLPAQGQPEQNRDIARYKELEAIWRRGEGVTVVTGLDVYTNMVITRVGTTRDPNSGQALAINVDFEEVILTTTETVDVPPSKARRKAGRQNAEAVKDAQSATEQLEASAQGTTTAAASQSGASRDPEATAVQEKQTRSQAGSLNNH